MSRLRFIDRMIILCGLTIFFTIAAQAASHGDSVAFAFKGHLVQLTVPCTINQNQVINVPFGNVSVSKVSSGDYVQNLSYSLDCGSSATSVSMMLKATPTDWHQQAMVSSVTGLGVRILNGGVPIDLNNKIAIELSNPPVLQAQLVTAPGAQLTEQAFTSGGTLIAEYQ